MRTINLDRTHPWVQYEGVNKMRVGSVNFSLLQRSRVHHRNAIEMHTTDIFVRTPLSFITHCYPGSQCAQSLPCKFLPAWEWFLGLPNTMNSDATHTLSKSSASLWVPSGPYPVGKSPAPLLYLTHTFTCVLATT